MCVKTAKTYPTVRHMLNKSNFSPRVIITKCRLKGMFYDIPVGTIFISIYLLHRNTRKWTKVIAKQVETLLKNFK